GRGYSEERLPLLLFNSMKVLIAIAKVKKQLIPDLVLIPDILPSWVVIGFLVGKALNRPIIATVQLVPLWLLESSASDFKSLYRHFRSKYSLLKTLTYSIAAFLFTRMLSKCYLIFVSR
ncbi:MAG: hypothetical protein QXH64_04975, partial [Nitrososphaeria archaeon]